jgi:integrase
MADDRKLERTITPGIYRRHANGCKRKRHCDCPYIVRWKQGGKSHKQMFPRLDLAREFKNRLGAGMATRQPLSSKTVADYYESWLPDYTGRTVRGLEDSTRRGYRISFEGYVLPLPIASTRMRDLSAPNVRQWLRELEREGATPATIRRAKVALSVMLACAVEDGKIAANPAAGVRYVPSEQTRRRYHRRKPHPLTAADVTAILNAMPEPWRAFFALLAQTGLRIGELLGLTWEHVHLGDDAHIMVAEQVYRGQRKKLKTEASMARVPLSATMASWLSALRPENAEPGMPVFPSATGGPLNYANVYNRVLRPVLIDAGLAIKVGEDARGRPAWDYQGIAFHAFRKACGSLLLHHGKTLKQVQGWLRHSQLTTTMNVYITQVDGGLGGADAWDEILGDAWDHAGGEPRQTIDATSRQAPSGGARHDA